MLTDDECNQFRRLPLSFNDMVRVIYNAGKQQAIKEHSILNAEIELAILTERERCAKVIETYPYWIGRNGKQEIAEAIRKHG